MAKRNKYIKFLIFPIWEGPSEKFDSDQGFYFHGKIIHIPFDKHFIVTGEDSVKPGGMHQMEFEAIKEMGSEIINRGFIPLGQTHQVERYETIDASKADISILYRIPCREMTEKERIQYGVTSSAKIIPFVKKAPPCD